MYLYKYCLQGKVPHIFSCLNQLVIQQKHKQCKNSTGLKKKKNSKWGRFPFDLALFSVNFLFCVPIQLFVFVFTLLHWSAKYVKKKGKRVSKMKAKKPHTHTNKRVFLAPLNFIYSKFKRKIGAYPDIANWQYHKSSIPLLYLFHFSCILSQNKIFHCKCMAC